METIQTQKTQTEKKSDFSFLAQLSADQLNQVKQFISTVHEAKVLNDIYKMILTESVFARLLFSQNFNQFQALSQLKAWVKWRQNNKVDLILEHDFLQYDQIKEFMPTGFHEIDRQGRPIFYLQLGQLKSSDLLQAAAPDVISKFFLKEMEHTWREKFPKCIEISGFNVDQIMIVVDLKGASLKQLTNKQNNAIFKALVQDLGKQFPEIIHNVIVLNAPMMFENHYLTEIKPQFSQHTASKILITSESCPRELLEMVSPENLPQIYGGTCNCQAQCIYSEKGPWTDVINFIDYQDKQITVTEQEWLENRKQVYPAGLKEEFKLIENEEDEVDLLNEQKEKEDLSKLKDMFKMNLPQPIQKKEKKKSQFAEPKIHSRMQQQIDLGACTAQNTLADEQYDDDTTGTSGTSGSFSEKQTQQQVMFAGLLSSKLSNLNQD